MRAWAVLLPLIVVGCVTAKKRMEQAQRAEAAGRWTEAADLYIDALGRDPDYPGAREGLRRAGDRAIEDHLRLAREFESSGRDAKAAPEYERADRLYDRAAVVRVSLSLPADYAERKRRTYGRVVEEALDNADQLLAAGRAAEAASAYRAAVARYEPTGEQVARAQDGRYRALVTAASAELEAGHFDRARSLADRAVAVYGAGSDKSAEAAQLVVRIGDARYRALLATAGSLMEDGRYQAAYETVEEALAVHGGDEAAAADAQALRDRIVELGTVSVAAAPVWRTERAADRVPAGLLDEVNDRLAGEHWTKPPLFVAVVDPPAVRQALRRLGYDRRVLGPVQARAVGAQLESDYVVVAHVTRCTWDRREQPQPYTVATRDGRGAQVLVYSQRVLDVVCAFRVVAAADGAVVGEGSVEAGAERRMRHATYDGDMRALLLSQKEHEWFDKKGRARVDRSLERETATMLADQLASVAYAEITKRLP